MKNMLSTIVLLLSITWLVQADAIILRTTDSGISWSQENSYCDELLNDVAKDFTGIAVSVGNNGTILRRSNGIWSDVSVSGIYDDLNSVMYRVGRFYVAGDNGRIFYSEDSGLTWEPVTQAPITINDLWVNPTTGGGNELFVCGPNGAAYELVGSSWVWINTGTTNNLYAFAGHICQGEPDYVLGYYGSCYNFSTGNTSALGNTHFRGATDVASGSGPMVAVGSRGDIYRKGYTGSWYKVNSETNNTLYAVSLSGLDPSTDSDVFCAVGSSGTILRSTDTGQTWSQVFSGTTRTLRGVSTHVTGEPSVTYIVGEDNTSAPIGLSNNSDASSPLEVTPLSSGTLSVRSETDSQFSVVLFDITGRTIEEQSAQTVSGQSLINFDAPRGVYLYSVSTGVNVTTGKLVISE